MKHELGDNAANTSRPVLTNGAAEWVAFDRLPFAVREALRESPFDYSAREVLEFYEQAAVSQRSSFSFFDSVKKDIAGATDETLQTIRHISETDLQEYWRSLGKRFRWSNARLGKSRQAFQRPLTSR